MEWVETTGKSAAEAEERALDQLGVARDEAEFEVLDEPKKGLFGLLRGEARVRARVKPAAVRPKQDRRRSRPKNKKKQDDRGGGSNAGSSPDQATPTADASSQQQTSESTASAASEQQSKKRAKKKHNKEQNVDNPTPNEVADAAAQFLDGLVTAFGVSGSTSLTIEGTEIDAAVDGSDLGVMIGPGGRTLNAIQDLTRVSAQRRLGDHETRLRVDIGGYRVKRSEALEAFTRKIAAEVTEHGQPKALEPMASADRKIVHDTVNAIDGVESRSDGDDPRRRVIIAPSVS